MNEVRDATFLISITYRYPPLRPANFLLKASQYILAIQ